MIWANPLDESHLLHILPHVVHCRIETRQKGPNWIALLFRAARHCGSTGFTRYPVSPQGSATNVARGGVYKGRDPASPNPSGFPTRGVTTPQKAQPAPCAYGWTSHVTLLGFVRRPRRLFSTPCGTWAIGPVERRGLHAGTPARHIQGIYWLFTYIYIYLVT